jgi:NAD(P)-dependent dehydrogenase (short-subunit alcohol dehydrogenase family)
MRSDGTEGRFTGRSAIVTGAGGGIGRAIALALAAEGAQVLIVGRNQDKLDETVSLARQRMTSARCDVSDAEAVAELEQRARLEFGGLDVLVDNAATGVNSAFHETPLHVLDAVIATNIRGAYLILQVGLRLMLESGGGSIVVVGSLGGLRPAPRASAYGMSKAAVHAMTRHAAMEYADRNIRVNTVAPGATETPLLNAVADEVKATMAAAIPLGRIATADQVARVALFLASDDADHVTGQLWGVDGGSSIGT